MTTVELGKIVDTAVDLVNRLGMKDRGKRIGQATERLKTETCRIAVIGQFKAGKSTLINKVFLKEDILFTDVLEATAVPTHIEYASRKRLQIRPYRLAEETIEFESDKKTVQTATLDELPPRVVEAPSADDIKVATSAETEEGRAALARETANVRLQWPAPNLKGLIVTDTPGINSLNEAVIATTYRVIPDADLTVFVTGASQLSDIELRFLKSHVFDKNVNRCMVVINYDPFYNPGANIPAIIKTIRAQLGSIGRPHIPVEAVDLRDTKRTLPQSFRDTLDAIKAKVLNTPAKDDYSVASIERKMIAFIGENALPARVEHASAVIRSELEAAKLECEVELAAVGKTEDEIAELTHKIEAEERKFRAGYERLGEEFLDDLRGVQNAHYKSLASGIGGLCKQLTDKLDACQNLTAVRQLLDGAVACLQPDVEEILRQTANQTKTRLDELSQKYQTAVQEIAKPWMKVTADGLAVDPGAIGRIPPALITVMDFMIFATVYAFPHHWLIDLILRGIASKIPILKSIMPAALFRKGLTLWLTKKLRDQFEGLKAEVKTRIDAAYAEAEAKVKGGWMAQFDERVKGIRAPLEAAAKRRADPKRIAALDEAIKILTSLESAVASQ